MKMWSRVFSMILLLTVLTSCSTSDKSTQMIAVNRTEKPQKAQAVQTTTTKTTTTPSPYAEQIIKDTRKGIEPIAIEIPAIDVKAPVIGVGQLEDGEMAVPGDGETTGWYNVGYKPGEPGNAAIAGHVSSKRGPAVFFNLKKLKPGDEVIVTGKDMEKLVFEVVEVTSYPRLESPLGKIFGYTSRSALNLITCSGKYDPETTQNSERLVVYTQLKSE